MKTEEIRDMTAQEIQERVRELRKEQFRLTFRGATQELENSSLLRTNRRDIARMKTILRERELAGAES